MLELSSRGKIKKVLLVILILALLGASGFFGYKYFTDEECKPCEKCEVCDAVEDVTDNKEEIKVDVEEYMTVIPSYYDEPESFKIVIPKVTGDSKVIGEINKSIVENIFNKGIRPYDYDDGGEYPDSLLVDYSYKIQEDILYLALRLKLSPWNASGTGTFVYNYTYDIKNDKSLTLLESLKLLGQTDEQLVKENTFCNRDDKCKKEDLPEYITNDYGVYYFIEKDKFIFEYDS